MRISRKVVIAFLISSFVWIIVSDTLLNMYIPNSGQITFLQTTKAAFYILSTAFLIYKLLENEIARRATLETNYSKLFHLNPQPMWIYDIHSLKFLAVNEAAIRLYGYSEAEFLSMTALDIRPIAEQRRFVREFDEKMRLSAYKSFEPWKHLKKDGSLIDVEIHSHMILWAGHEARLVLSVDVTEQRKVEESRRKAEMLQAEIDKQEEIRISRNQLISMVVHEFRSPLTAIQATTMMLQNYYDKLTEDKKKEQFNKINISIQKLVQMTNEMLVVSRLEAGKVTLQPEHFNLHLFCHQVMETYQSPQHEFIYEEEGDAAHVIADSAFINHILTNLISNAVKYSPNGGSVGVKVMVTEQEITFRISDQGIGIPEEAQAKLFTPFFRAPNVGKLEGTGLGLAIVKNYVELYGGTIEMSSVAGRGTTFHIRLPHLSMSLSSVPATSTPA